jgi:L-iditol 2-dehydrogenase
MKALLLSEYKKLAVAEMAEPQPGEDDLLVRVRACGICGSDVHGWDGSSGRRIPPLVMGHEAAGEVVSMGPRVQGFAVGDRVCFDSTVYCGDCFFCRKGQINLCDRREVLGVSTGEFRRMGAFAEYVTVPARICYQLPATLRFEHAAMVEAVSIAVHAAAITPLQLGDVAVVVGSGMIGLLVVQVLKLKGCSRVIAVDLEDSKLALARELGATDVVNPRHTDAAEAIRAMTGGRGADVAFEVVGATATVQAAIQSVKKGGSVTLVGNLAPKVELPLQSVVTRQITLYGSCASAGEIPVCIDLLASGAIRVDPIISATAPLSEGPAWFDRLYGHEPGLMKVILKP